MRISLIAISMILISATDCSDIGQQQNIAGVSSDWSPHSSSSDRISQLPSQRKDTAKACEEGNEVDADHNECMQVSRKMKHKRQVVAVGMPCQENIDCYTISGGSYCDTTKRCNCLPAYIDINGYCWPKRNPGDSCTYPDQCSSVSANSQCVNGVCQCANGQLPFETLDGVFCIPPGECPTNGPYSQLRDPATGSIKTCSTPEECVLDASDPSIVKHVYNCLCINATRLPGVDPTLACINDPAGSYCCPVRAIACVQPRDEGTGPFSGGGSSSRWWYNSATDTCESFPYRGTGGNANNFQTKALCESYCRTACPRGKPLLTVDPLSGTAIKRCSLTITCGDGNYFCNTEGRNVQPLCCPTPTFICGRFGGVSTDAGLVPDMPGEGEDTYKGHAVTRYYYDSTAQQCRRFTYKGLGGTYNNFQTEAECRGFCVSTLCDGVGEPLRSNGGTVRCGIAGTSSCPGKYTCNTQGYCCPNKEFVCNEPRAVGGCQNFVERWWFNPMTRTCESFQYSGCQGNFNNFRSYRECSNFCSSSSAKPVCPQGEAAKEIGGNTYIICSSTANPCPAEYYCHFDGTRYGCCPTRAKTCSTEVADPGTVCITPVTRWYYNSQTRVCDTFIYNGCDGNSNNFATKIDCQDYCTVGGCPEGGEPYRDTYTGQYRLCGREGTECPSGFMCSIVSLGTTNRFNYCCPTRAYICTLGIDQGQQCGTRSLTRFHFSLTRKSCESFTYNGCGGNRNNFATMEQCQNYCSAAGCPPGTVALQDTRGKSAVPCDSNIPTSCTSGYTCMFSITLQQGVCCGSTAPPGSCPAGQVAYMDSFTYIPLQCQPNVQGSCPNGIFCQYSFTLKNSFCCSSGAVQCPQGGDPYTDSSTGQPRQCTPGLANACPQGYTCQLTTVIVGDVASATGHCCGASNVCGRGYIQQYVNNRPVACTPNQVPSSCTPPSICRTNPNTRLSYCCIPSGQLTSVCAAGKEPYLIQGAPSVCAPGSSNTVCPAGFTCDPYGSSGSSYCCRTISIIPLGATCPAPYVPLQPMITCSPGVPGSCPISFICMYDTTHSGYICCGPASMPVTGVNPCAPDHGQVYVNPASRQPQICALGTGQTGCPAGYSCAYSIRMRNYYCCTRRIGQGTSYDCPVGHAYLYPGTQTPLVCAPRGPPCPTGYHCRHSPTTSAWYCCSNMIREGSLLENEKVNGQVSPDRHQ